MAPIRPTTEMKRRKTPEAVMPPMIGRSVTMPVTLPRHTNGKGRKLDGATKLTVNGHTNDEERHENVNDIQTHQSVLGTRETTAHNAFCKIKKIYYV